MGLKISTFSKNGQVFTDAYAKISNVRYDNDSKIASFGIKIYVSKTDKNLICELQNNWAKITPDTDMVAQCYVKINTIITQTKAQITALQLAIDAIVNNDNLKLMKENQLNQMLNNELLQLDGATEW